MASKFWARVEDLPGNLGWHM